MGGRKASPSPETPPSETDNTADARTTASRIALERTKQNPQMFNDDVVPTLSALAKTTHTRQKVPINSAQKAVPLPRPSVDEPTIGITFHANNGPYSALDGKKVTAREIRERLEHEALHNVAIRLEEGGSSDAVRVLGRGELQMAVLMEQMRREGYEMCVSKPEVRIIEKDGQKHEPFELATLDFPEVAMFTNTVLAVVRYTCKFYHHLRILHYR